MCIKLTNERQDVKTWNPLRISNNNITMKKQPKNTKYLKNDADRIKTAIKTYVAKRDGDKLGGETKPQIKSESQNEVKAKQQQDPAAINTFINVMVHASKCKSCPQLSCRKMRIVLQHYIGCNRLVEEQRCQVCEQLLSIVTQHAILLCRVGRGDACPVPLCDQLRGTATCGFDAKKIKKEEKEPKEEKMDEEGVPETI